MKTCPVCGATYSARISFCFEDGAVLVTAAAAAEQALSAPPARHVPSRVATPVAPARRGRSLLAQKGGNLTFSPPRATATPGVSPVRGADLSPAPLEPLELPYESATDDLIASLPMPSLDARPQVTDNITPAAAANTSAGRLDTPSPVDASPIGEIHVDDADSRTFDDLDFPDMGPDLGVGEDYEHVEEEWQEKKGVPVWWYAAGAAAVVALLLLITFVAGAAGLLGTAALTRADGDEVVAVEPRPEPVAEVAPAPVVPDVSPAPDVEVPPAPEPVAAVVAVVPPAPEPAPAAVVAPAPAPVPSPAPVVAPAPAPAPGSGSPWGSLDVQQSLVSVSSLPAGGKVTIDGEAVGTTPTKVTLPYGEHTVVVSLSGYADAERSVRVDEARESVAFDLQPQAKAASFIVVLEGSDGAMLYVDGVKAGPLPARVTLTEGSHQFTVESPSGSYTITREISTSSGTNVINLAG